MLKQANKYKNPVAFVQAVSQSANIAGHIKARELQRIGREVHDEYALDKDSMGDWLDRMEKGIKLATLIKNEKTYPFDKASNVIYPLITSAALQFNARAYPAIVNTEEMVKVRTYGADPQGQKADRAQRVASHMSYQLANQIEEWEEETDKLLVQLPVVGTMVRKVWYDPAQDRIRCRVIDAGKFIVNDRTTVLSDAPRASEEMDLYPHEVRERQNAGTFLDVDLEMQDNEDSKHPETFIEQHTRLDLDGDGYEEPYIVTIHDRTQKVVRVVGDFDERDVTYITETQEDIQEQVDPMTGEMIQIPVTIEVPVSIKAIRRGSYFVPYHFEPSLDGGFFGTGLGLLLGDISDAINSIINMLLDAGHMSSLGGGFLGSEFRIKGGSQRFRPGEWKQVAASGADIRSSVVPMTFPGPDATLYQMLGMLIDAGREIASVKDIMTGDSGKSTQTATTTIALIEQGMAVFTASYKRIYRSLKKEFKLIAKINAETVGHNEYNAFHDGQYPADPQQDYSAADMDICPVADPQTVTKMQEAAKAQLLMQMAEMGLVDMAEVADRILQSMDITEREDLIPEPDPAQAEMAQMQMQLEAQKVQADSEKAAADQMKAQAEMIKAQTPVDHSADIAKAEMEERVRIAEAGIEERVKMAELAIKAELEREKQANDLLIEREKMVADLKARQIEAAASDGGDQASAEGFQALIETIQAQIAMANAPKEVVRDENGQVVGVRPVMQ